MHDGAIGSAQMSEHGGNGDVSKSKGVIVESSKVEAINSTEELLFEFLVQGGSKGEFSNLSFEHTDEFTDNKLGSTGWNDRSVTRMHRELEGKTGKLEVVGSRHDKAEVSMATTTMSRRDGMRIGINFLGEEFEQGVGWHPGEWGQVWEWESNC